MDSIRFFKTAADFRAWLVEHHARASELHVGFHKVAAGRPIMTWPESVDEALAYGWIDGVRRRIAPMSYRIRFMSGQSRQGRGADRAAAYAARRADRLRGAHVGRLRCPRVPTHSGGDTVSRRKPYSPA